MVARWHIISIWYAYQWDSQRKSIAKTIVLFSCHVCERRWFKSINFTAVCNVYRSGLGYGIYYQQYFSFIMASTLMVKEVNVPGENHRSTTSHWQTLSHNVVTSGIRTHKFIGDMPDCTGSCKSNYHTTTKTTTPCPSMGPSLRTLNDSLQISKRSRRTVALQRTKCFVPTIR